MLEEIRSAFYTDKEGVSALISFLGTLILGAPYAILGNGTLGIFILVVVVPMIGIAVYREKVLSVRNLRDYNILNILLTCWLPLLIVAIAAFS